MPKSSPAYLPQGTVFISASHSKAVALTRQDLAGAKNLTHYAIKAGWINPRRD